MSWSVSLSFSAVAFEETEFDWSTDPLSPLLLTRMGALTFFASFWTAAEAATASCALAFFWSAVWMPVPEEQPQSLLPSRPSLLQSSWPLLEPEPIVWSMSWSVSLSLSAFAFDDTSFDWVTSPLSPLLPTRIGLLTFLASFCSADENAAAACRFRFFWSAVWIASPPFPRPQWSPLPDPIDWSTSWSLSLSFSAVAF